MRTAMTTHPDAHHAARVDLAAAFRWFARLGMHESVANHFSLAVSEDGQRFLMIEPLEKPEYQSLTLVSNWRPR